MSLVVPNQKIDEDGWINVKFKKYQEDLEDLNTVDEIDEIKQSIGDCEKKLENSG